MKYVLGIDLGTSGVKTVLFDASGRQSCEAAREYPLYQPQNGWAEQEPEDWYEGAAATIRDVMAQSGVAASDILGIGISGQMQHMVGCNRAGTMFAINKDKNAPVFKQCDYGIVGDVKDVLPKLAAAL